MAPRTGIDISGKSRAPSLAGAVSWLNVARPLALEDLRGKVVLLDFWTYCCINCMHVIPDLKRLEAKYPDELVVIGVHSAKFTTEKESENIREAVLRYGIEHPVANDANFAIWRRYGVKAWPTVVLIDPEGKIVGAVSGEGVYDVLDEAVGALVEKFQGSLDTRPLPIALEKDKVAPTLLSYPGKVLADEDSGRLFIADTGHNRIVVTDFAGKLLAVAGTGKAGWTDGTFAQAAFDHPQGMVLSGNALYVADTENHLLRRLDLDARTVETVAGTGVQGRRGTGGPARTTPLNSPWDVTVLASSPDVYIAMAGAHQIWVYRPETEVVEPVAGSGHENIVDGPVGTAALAQPSGITSDGTDLYFADSEVSAVRMIEMMGGRRVVKTLIGTGLFNFGDKDGPFDKALLQHPLGIVWHMGKLYVADTYNNKVKVIDLAEREIETLAGGFDPWSANRMRILYEPGGVSAAGGKVYVADTNNHAVRVIDLAMGTLANFTIITAVEAEEKPAFEVPPSASKIDAGCKAVPASGEAAIAFDLPEGYHLNPDAPPVVQLHVIGGDGREWTSGRFNAETKGNIARFRMRTGDVEDPRRVEAIVSFYYCLEHGGGACYIGEVFLEAPVEPGDGTVQFSHPVKR